MFTSKAKGIHSHIKGLETGESLSYVGHDKAREAAELIVEMVKSKTIAGRAILLVGPSGCGKTALSIAISEELGIKIPFNILNGSEIYSAEVRKTEVLLEALRKSILLRIKEFKNIYEGEVVSLNDVNLEEIEITLRATKGTKTFRISKLLNEQITQQNIKKGDVVYIESSAGIIKKMGRGESHMNDYDLESEKYVPLPKGDIFRSKEVIQETTLHNLDLSFVQPTGQDVLDLVTQVASPKKPEITEKLRKEVDQLVKNYLEVDKAEIIPGILFIDDINVLDEVSFSYLNKAIDSPYNPLVILSSNNLAVNENFVFGIPRDLASKLLMIPIDKHTRKNEIEIIKMRIFEEDLNLNESCLKLIFDLLESKSLRYCLSILPILKSLDREITKEDIKEVVSIFE
jgi:RuvB-like protein 1 (pontin 52)